MKTTRRLIIFAGAFLAAASGWAQTVQFINVTRSANYVQTGASTVTADPSTPFSFKATIEGDNGVSDGTPVSGATTTFTAPGGSAIGLAYDSSGHHWRYQDDTQTSMANLNSVYGTGPYNFSINGGASTASVAVSSFASSQLQTPMFTLSGGTWVGSTYQMSAGAVLTVAFNPVYSGSVGSTASFHYDAELNGMGGPQEAQDFINYDATSNTTATYLSTPPNFVSSALSAGSYSFGVSYSEVQNPAASGYASALGASLLEYHTNFSIQVIPEPSVYAAILGVISLAGVMLHRRRRMQAA